MEIFVDADACPVIRIVEDVAKEYGLPVTLLCDTNHIFVFCIQYCKTYRMPAQMLLILPWSSYAIEEILS